MEYTQGMKLSLGEDVKFLFDAILSVHQNYITYETHAIHDGNEEHLERVFAYELYHQWAKLLAIIYY